MKKTSKSRLDRDAARKLREELLTEIENDNPLLGSATGAGLKGTTELIAKGE
jgi:hypothetical protein